MARPRRRSSNNLGADPRGDTSAPALATLTPVTSPPSTPSPSEKLYKPHSKRRKARSALRRWKQISLRHTWLNPLIIVLIILCGYAVYPSRANPLHQAIFLSYPEPPETKGGPIMYSKGKSDIAFVTFYTIVLSFTREFLMQRVIRPWAIRCGIRGRAKQSRFMEQVYTAIYFGAFGPFGMYVMSRSSLWYFNTTAMFEGYPHKQHEGIFKAYYLLQASYWSQQAIVLLLQLEKPRKDFKELILHHVVTLSLIGLSYRFHFAKMGIAVYITHDISDFFLATSKTLNYLDSVIVGPYFGFFILVWVYLRHYINLTILYATLTEFRTIGPFELDWQGGQFKCFLSQCVTFGLLASLQAVNLFWLFLILRIVRRYIAMAVVEDVRSDNEEDAEEEDDREEIEGKPALIDNGEAKKSAAKDAKKMIEGERGMETDKPAVLLNGEAVGSGEAHPEGIVERKKNR